MDSEAVHRPFDRILIMNQIIKHSITTSMFQGGEEAEEVVEKATERNGELFVISLQQRAFI